MKIVRIILLVISILAALGLVATTLAGAVAPSQSLQPSVLAFGFLPMLGLNVLLVAVWLLMGRWEFLLPVAVIVARFSVVGLYFQVGGRSEVPPAEEHPGMVTLMSYNVHNFGGKDSELHISDSNVSAFLALVREYQPDVLCLTEFKRVKGVSTVDSLELMGYNHWFASAGSDTRPTGTVVFSRLPITYVKKIDHAKLMVDLMHGERQFRLCCVHMDSYSFDQHDREEIDHVCHGHVDSLPRRMLHKVHQTVLEHEREWNEQLRPIVTECSLPLVVAGDFNDIPSSWLCCRLRDNLKDTYCDKGQGFCTTYHAGFPRFRIDAVYRSAEFTTLSYKRIRTTISDHYPVMVALELDKEKK